MKLGIGFLIMVGVVLAGAGASFWGFRNWRLSQASSSEPEPITMAELEKGIPDNPYRKLARDVVPLYESVVFEKNTGKRTFEVGTVYYAVVARDGPLAVEYEAKLAALREKYGEDKPIPPGERPRISKPGAIIATRRYLSESEMEKAISSRGLPQSDMTGLVINRVGGLGSEQIRLLRQGYPGFDPETTVVFELDRLPPSGLLSMACTICGLALASGACFMLWMAWRDPAEAKGNTY